MGYEHDKSMTNVLKDKGWIMSESAGLDEENMDFSMMKTSFVLTEEGKKQNTRNCGDVVGIYRSAQDTARGLDAQ